MATSLTYGSLRQLARLYRSGVDGAAELLAAIVEDHADQLPDLLGFPLQNLERLREHDDPVAVLVATIEGAPRVARAVRDRIHFESAASMAARLAETAERRVGGHVALDVSLLAEALARYPGRIVTFGTRGSCGSVRLRAILRGLRGVRATSVVLTREHLAVAYQGAHSRGLIRLVLHEPIVDAETLVVPVDVAAQPGIEAPVEVDRGGSEYCGSAHGRRSPDEDAPGAIPGVAMARRTPEPVLRHRGGAVITPSQPVTRVAVRMLDALLAAALGGGQ